MLAGINKLWIALFSDLNNPGFHCNGKRVEYSFRYGKDWEQIPIARDTSIHETDEFSIELKSVVFGSESAFLKYNSRKVIIKYLTNSNELRAFGFDGSIILTIKYSTGTIPGDTNGCSLSFSGSSKITIEIISTTTPLVITPIKYGPLYNAYTILDPRGIAPEGWRVPTHNDYLQLLEYPEISGGKLKTTYFEYWDFPNTGATNEFGFNAKGSGHRIAGTGFAFLKQMVKFWLNYEMIEGECFSFGCVYNYSNIFLYQLPKNNGYSCRLIKSDSTNPALMLDADGNVYPTIKIGEQVWMADNLIVKHYNNGDAIPEVTDEQEWASLTSGAWCAYNNDHNNILK